MLAMGLAAATPTFCRRDLALVEKVQKIRRRVKDSDNLCCHVTRQLFLHKIIDLHLLPNSTRRILIMAAVSASGDLRTEAH